MVDMIYKLTKDEDHDNAEYFADIKALVYAVNDYLRDITSYRQLSKSRTPVLDDDNFLAEATDVKCSEDKSTERSEGDLNFGTSCYTEEGMDKLIEDNTRLCNKYPTLILHDKDFKLVLSTHKLQDSR